MAEENSLENDDTTDLPDPTEKCIVDELLTSVWHAVVHSKTDKQIAQELSLFYDDEAIRNARKKLLSFYAFRKRSERSTKKDPTPKVKAEDIVEIVKAVRDGDWKAKGVKFTASKLDDVYIVKGVIEDQLLLQNEVRQLRMRLEDVENLVQAVIGMSSKIDCIGVTLKAIEIKNRKLFYLKESHIVLWQGLPPPRLQLRLAL